jgi:hypothetical protein
MKKLLFTLTLVVAGIFAATAQISNDETATNGAVITFSEKTFDFGNIPHNIPVTHEFTFTNTGNGPLIINSVNKSCGCTVPEYSSEPIMPGKTGVIKVTYNAAALGTFSKTVTVNSNGGQITLTIKGNVVETPAQPPVTNPNK